MRYIFFENVIRYFIGQIVTWQYNPNRSDPDQWITTKNHINDVDEFASSNCQFNAIVTRLKFIIQMLMTSWRKSQADLSHYQTSVTAKFKFRLFIICVELYNWKALAMNRDWPIDRYNASQYLMSVGTVDSK